jgi:HD superfamily phosphohydrolase
MWGNEASSASGRHTIIRDAVHGDMVFEHAAELAVVDTPEFQRLRGIRQLGTANLIYPSANHTRFDHSLGTAYVAGRMLDAIAANTGRHFDDHERLLVSVAALCHDITHIPYGHTFEDERKIFERHDVPGRTRDFLRLGTLGARLQALGLRDEVEAILTKRPGTVPPWMVEVVSGTVCSDLLDYLARDALFCGLPLRYDERLYRYLTLDDDGHLTFAIARGGLIREDAITELVQLLRIRYMLSERVYYHHAKVASGAMVSRMVERAVDRGLRLEDLYPLQDQELFWMLERCLGDDPVFGRLRVRFRARSLYKRCYLLTRQIPPQVQADLIRRYHEDRRQRERVEAELERCAGLAPGDLIIYCPTASMALKEANIAVEVGGQVQSLASLKLPEVDTLLEKHRQLWRFYVFIAAERQRQAERVATLAEEFFGEPNQLAGIRQGQLRFRF